jgi:hypothetical protein
MADVADLRAIRSRLDSLPSSFAAEVVRAIQSIQSASLEELLSEVGSKYGSNRSGPRGCVGTAAAQTGQAKIRHLVAVAVVAPVGFILTTAREGRPAKWPAPSSPELSAWRRAGL